MINNKYSRMSNTWKLRSLKEAAYFPCLLDFVNEHDCTKGDTHTNTQINSMTYMRMRTQTLHA